MARFTATPSMFPNRCLLSLTMASSPVMSTTGTPKCAAMAALIPASDCAAPLRAIRAASCSLADSRSTPWEYVAQPGLALDAAGVLLSGRVKHALITDDSLYEDPPLYPPGKLAEMTVDELKKEFDRQCDLQGRLGDAEYIDDRAVEATEARCRLVEAELKRRG